MKAEELKQKQAEEEAKKFLALSDREKVLYCITFVCISKPPINLQKLIMSV